MQIMIIQVDNFAATQVAVVYFAITAPTLTKVPSQDSASDQQRVGRAMSLHLQHCLQCLAPALVQVERRKEVICF